MQQNIWIVRLDLYELGRLNLSWFYFYEKLYLAFWYVTCFNNPGISLVS